MPIKLMFVGAKSLNNKNITKISCILNIFLACCIYLLLQNRNSRKNSLELKREYVQVLHNQILSTTQLQDKNKFEITRETNISQIKNTFSTNVLKSQHIFMEHAQFKNITTPNQANIATAYPLNFIEFCKRRWDRMSNEWIAQSTHTGHKQHILLVMGLLNIGFDGSGSYTGDIMQWCDLAAGLHVLGTQVSIYGGKKRHRHLPDILTSDFNITAYSLIFIDYFALGMFQRMYATAKQGHVLDSVLCRFRILDEFGTERSFIRKENPIRNVWVPRGIHLREEQILTFEPHHIQEGDFHQNNTFLGYTVSSMPNRTRKAEWRALLWGKLPVYFENVMPMLRLLCEFVQLTTTVRGLDLPHTCLRVVGRVPDNEYLPFVQSHALYVGSGEPAMGFGGAEAAATGLMVLNPQHNPPWTVEYGSSRLRGSPVLKGKPTRTIFKYQNTILGDDSSLEAARYVHNVNVQNLSDVKRVIARVRAIYDADAEGLSGYVSPLLRVEAFCARLRGILQQRFC